MAAVALVFALGDAVAEDAVTLDRVVVASTRLRAVPAFEVPASLSTVTLGDDDARADLDVAEPLRGVPGLLARDRQNDAQDTQLSIRGFGARATFGVRGLRLYSDGIPATMPDGQGQVSHFNLLAGERIEVLRGPFSALYGNSSGGVVQLWSGDGGAPAQARVQASLGRDETRALGARLRGGGETVGYQLALSGFDSDGYREHSAARRLSGNAKLDVAFAGGGQLDLVANALDAPDAQDPLGLTRAQADADPRQAVAAARQFDTRKSVRQQQLGARFTQPLRNGHALQAMAYGGARAVEQFLSVPVAAQRNPLNSGGVIDLDNDYGGGDLRWSWRGALLGREAELHAGISGERQRQHRRGFENFVGDTLGVRGALRRDERNTVDSFDQYAQAWWRIAPRWALLLGARRSEVRFRSEDGFVTAANPDDSGRVRFRETTPVAGLSFAPDEDLRVYASFGRGFETPTFNELAYRADGGAGLAFDLRPAVSDHGEFGLKWRGDGGLRLEAALFRADSDDELAVARNVAGRSSFRNVGRARREGAEVAAALPLGEAWTATLAYTRLDARFRDDFLQCVGAGCTEPGQRVAAGTRIPGLPQDQAYARLQWSRGAWQAAAEAVAFSAVAVNDIAGESAPGYALLHLEAARDWRLRDGRLRGFVRVDNALDRAHIGSVIVNEGNGRFYEPGPGRGVTVGLRWLWQGGAAR